MSFVHGRPGGAFCAAAALLLPAAALAAEVDCDSGLVPATVVRCALAASPEVHEARLGLEVLAGQRLTASTWLPSNPSLELLGAHRTTVDGQQDLNTYLLLSQEVEVGGQRAARLDEVEAATAAQVRKVAVAEQETAAAALRAWLEAAAAREQAALAGELLSIAETQEKFTTARVGQGLLPELDARLGSAESTRLRVFALEARRAFANARSLVAYFVGVDPGKPPEVEGGLAALPLAPPSEQELVDRALLMRGEIAAAAQETRMFAAREELLRRLNLPNPTFSLFAQRDGFGEAVFGAGVGLPLSFVGPNRKGEIEATGAQRRQVETASEGLRRRVRLEVARALATWNGRREAAALYTPERVAATRRDLIAIRDQIGTGALSLREAVVVQRSLVEVLQNDVEVRLALALATVELIRAASLPWPGAAQ